MKKKYLLSLFILAVTSSVSYSQDSAETNPYENSIQHEDERTEKGEARMNVLINELQTTFEVQLTTVDDILSLIISSNGSTNRYSVQLKDNFGKIILDGNIDPNTQNKIELTDESSESYMLSVYDMSTLKSSVFKITFN
jgi:hypothetical protein